jgi:carbonic anhydrase
MKKTLLSFAFISLIATISAEEIPVKAPSNTEHHAAHWGYKGESAPEHWGEMSDKFTLCSTGENQSPINIKSNFDVELPAITFNYTAKPTKILNNGHTIQIDIAAGSDISVDGKTFQLKQFHFHTPSENTIDGKIYPLEAHFVHRSADIKQYAVVAVMFEEGAANPILEKIWEKMPVKARTSVKFDPLDYTQLQPKDKDYYRFNGSFTTPPCTEGVYWHLLKKPLTASKEQIETFFAILHHPNNRPIQKTGARIIIE